MHILLYTTQTCPYCKLAENLLKELGVEYHKIDVNADQETAKKMVTKSGQMGVPVIEINGKIIVGFNPEVIKEAVMASRK